MAIAPGIFRQYDIRGITGHDLTEEAAYGVGRGYAALLAQRGIVGAVAVGRDNRPSGSKLRDALVRGLTASGVDVIDIDVVPTPILYWCLHHLPVVGGIQITGSHNPPEYNGFKLCVGFDSVHDGEIQELRRLIEAGSFPAGGAEVTHQRVIENYVDDIVARTGVLSRRLKIVGDVAQMSAITTLDRTAFGVGQGEWQATDQIPAKVSVKVQLVARRN